MRDRIVNTAIESLRTEGLRFSVDTIASKLKISKKTIYKFFPDKETLAYSIYEKYYGDATAKAEKIAERGDDIKYHLLLLYNDAGFMVGSDIFNKYKLNDNVYSYAVKLHHELWIKILKIAAPSADDEESEILRAIIDGGFEKAGGHCVSPELVARKLVNLL